jgi:hypothetical protein
MTSESKVTQRPSVLAHAAQEAEKGEDCSSQPNPDKKVSETPTSTNKPDMVSIISSMWEVIGSMITGCPG